MTTDSSVDRAPSFHETGGRPVLSRRDHYITLLLTSWTTVGLFIDLWAHGQAKPETFFSPWHAVLYSGFVATGIRLLWPIVGAVRAGHSALEAAPAGYSLGVVGVLLFILGGAGDLVWHELFGIEQGVEALMSPPHLVLFG